MISLNQRQKGFTIAELLIATAIFSMMMLVVSFVIISIGKNFNKGVTETRTQDAARNIIDKITKDIQFGGLPITSPGVTLATPYAICIGQDRFSINVNQELVDGVNHGVILDTPSLDSPPETCAISPPITNLTGGSLPSGSPRPLELLSPGMRVTDLTVVPLVSNPTVYQVHITVVYGDDDLISGSGSSVVCNNSAGSQFCAVADISATVEARTRP
ncbi:MAG: PulJ/GspJ family protein [Candidatus Saccharimonadales bacterium]